MRTKYIKYIALIILLGIVLITIYIYPRDIAQSDYKNAIEYLKQDDIFEAIEALEMLSDSSDAFYHKLIEELYEYAKNEKCNHRANVIFSAIINYKDSLDLYYQSKRSSFALLNEKALVIENSSFKEGEAFQNLMPFQDLKGVLEVVAGDDFAVALYDDGTLNVLDLGHYSVEDAVDWESIMRISAGNNHLVGLKENRSIVAVGDNSFGQIEVDNWAGIQDVIANKDYTLAIDRNGRLETVGNIEINDINKLREFRVLDIAIGND